MNDKDGHTEVQHYIAAFRKGEFRKTWLFAGIAFFLVVDAVAFFLLLYLTFRAVAECPEKWHLFAAPTLSGTLLAVLTVVLVKGVFGMRHGSDGEDLSPPIIRTASDLGKQLGG